MFAHAAAAEFFMQFVITESARVAGSLFINAFGFLRAGESHGGEAAFAKAFNASPVSAAPQRRQFFAESITSINRRTKSAARLRRGQHAEQVTDLFVHVRRRLHGVGHRRARQFAEALPQPMHRPR